jgi:hypothetical protein
MEQPEWNKFVMGKHELNKADELIQSAPRAVKLTKREGPKIVEATPEEAHKHYHPAWDYEHVQSAQHSLVQKLYPDSTEFEYLHGARLVKSTTPEQVLREGRPPRHTKMQKKEFAEYERKKKDFDAMPRTKIDLHNDIEGNGLLHATPMYLREIDNEKVKPKKENQMRRYMNYEGHKRHLEVPHHVNQPAEKRRLQDEPSHHHGKEKLEEFRAKDGDGSEHGDDSMDAMEMELASQTDQGHLAARVEEGAWEDTTESNKHHLPKLASEWGEESDWHRWAQHAYQGPGSMAEMEGKYDNTEIDHDEEELVQDYASEAGFAASEPANDGCPVICKGGLPANGTKQNSAGLSKAQCLSEKIDLQGKMRKKCTQKACIYSPAKLNITVVKKMRTVKLVSGATCTRNPPKEMKPSYKKLDKEGGQWASWTSDGKYTPPGGKVATCYCPNGLKANFQSKPPCTQLKPHHCTKCNKGYFLNKTMHCQSNKCTCTNGQEVKGVACFEQGMHNCFSCKAGYSLTNNATWHGDKSVSKHKRAKDINRCAKNVCTCKHGTPATGAKCTKHNKNICEMCDQRGPRS